MPTAPAEVPALDRPSAYARDVLAGDVVAGRLVKLAAQRHFDDIASSEGRRIRWNPVRADRALDFFPAFCTHFEGPKAGQAVELAPWQHFAIGAPLGWERWDEEEQRWVRRFRTVFEEVAKKNGKSLTAGGLGNYLAFFDGEQGAQVVAAATKKDQAKLVWGAGRTMVEKSRPLRSRIKISALSLSETRTNSRFWPLGKDSKREDGINPSAILIDEVHRLEDRSLLNLLSNSMGARLEPLIWMITTAGATGPSVWADEHDYAVKVLEGILEDDQLFAYIANLDEDDDPFDEACWPKANPNLGVSLRWSEMRERAAEAREKPGAMNDFLRLRLNVRTQSEQRWMLPALWKANDAPPAEWAGRAAYGGLDLGSRDDLAAAIFLVENPPDSGPLTLDIVCRFWLPKDRIQERVRRDRVPYDRWVEQGLIIATPGNVTDYDTIRADLGSLVHPKIAGAPWLDIIEIGYDPHDATQLVNQLEGDGFSMVRIMQSAAEMDPAVSEVERLLAMTRLRHGGHPVLSWMVDNVVMIENAAGHRRPDKRRAREKIDGVPAMLMAMKRWMANAGAEQTWTAA